MSDRSKEAGAFESACLPPSREPNWFIRRHIKAVSEQGFGGELPEDDAQRRARLEDIDGMFPQPPVERTPKLN